ncbi:MAG: ABC transporter substrate-binding protein [Candidatus Sumerlaeaceae bacterium]|nr:ABC transporter substrate-binding protein [Candidatus Sumerlaeaceae bacterium]
MQRVLVIMLLWAAVVWGGCSRSDSGRQEVRDWAAIKASGVLRWGADEAGGAPYEFRNPKNPDERIGFEVEIAEEIGRRLGLRIEFVQTNWAQLLPALDIGNFDMAMSGIEITPDRREAVDFTRPYYIFAQQLVVRAGETDIRTLDDCRGRKVGTLGASAAERVLVAHGGIEVLPYEDNVTPYQDLEIGRLDAVLLDLPIAIYHAKPNEKLQFSGAPFAEGEYAIAVNKKSAGLREQLDRVLGEMIEDGTLKKILTKWELWNDSQGRL